MGCFLNGQIIQNPESIFLEHRNKYSYAIHGFENLLQNQFNIEKIIINTRSINKNETTFISQSSDFIVYSDEIYELDEKFYTDLSKISENI